jgi:molybdopterin molybdotransferase
MLGIHGIFEVLNKQKQILKTETVPLELAAGRLLACPVVSTLDSPPFDKAAMDGWAVRADDDRGPWKRIETVAAGGLASRPLKKGECTAIMTGAKIPEGCGKIIRIEFTGRDGDTISLKEEEPLINIIHRGENLKTGETVLTPRRLKPKEIGILASLGLSEIEVAVPPRIGIITTGSEIREPGTPLKDGEIYNSNGPQLVAQAEGISCPVQYYGITVDDEDKLYRIIRKGLDENDVLILSGGVSMGEFDFIPGTLEKLNVKREFHKAAIKPGRPLWFGSREDCFVFGLPGNPVSTFILFEVFVKHLIWHCCGLEYAPDVLRGELGREIRRRSSDRSEFLPVRFRENKVWPIRYHGSSHLNAMAEAEGLIVVDQGISEIAAGEIVHVRLL